MIQILKFIELVGKVIGGAFLYLVTILGVFKITNITYEINIPGKVLYPAIIVVSAIVIFYLVLLLICRKSITHWKIIVKAIEDQISTAIAESGSVLTEPVDDTLPRDPRINFTLARIFLSEIAHLPVLRLAIDLRISRKQLRAQRSMPLRLYIDNPGMFKTYLAFSDSGGKDALFLVDSPQSCFYERDYVFTLYKLLFQILSSATSSVSQIFSSDGRVTSNYLDFVSYYYYVYNYRILKSCGQYFIEIPIL
jgi:hypothetical protein